MDFQAIAIAFQHIIPYHQSSQSKKFIHSRVVRDMSYEILAHLSRVAKVEHLVIQIDGNCSFHQSVFLQFESVTIRIKR